MAMNRRDLFKWFWGAAVAAAIPAKAEEPIWDDAVPQKPYQKLTYFSDQGIEICHQFTVSADELEARVLEFKGVPIEFRALKQ